MIKYQHLITLITRFLWKVHKQVPNARTIARANEIYSVVSMLSQEKITSGRVGHRHVLKPATSAFKTFQHAHPGHTFLLWKWVALRQWMLKLFTFALHDPAPSLVKTYWTKLSPDTGEANDWLNKSQLKPLQIIELRPRQSCQVGPVLEWKRKSLPELYRILPVALYFNISLYFIRCYRILVIIWLVFNEVILKGILVIQSKKALADNVNMEKPWKSWTLVVSLIDSTV